MGSAFRFSSYGRDAPAALALPVLLGLVWLLFLPATHGPFLFDDFANLQNLSLLGPDPDVGAIGRYLHAFVGNPGRPLGALSFLIDDQAWPSDPAPFKRTNLLLHLLTGVVVFVLARVLLAMDPRLKRASAWLALLATAAWLLGPMQLSATMLVVQRMNILSALFTLLGLVGYVVFLRAGRAATAMALLWAMAGLAFLCKENGILAFAYAAVLNHTLLAGALAGMPRRDRVLAFGGTVAPLLVVAAAMAVHSGPLLASYQLREFSLLERLLTEPRILVDYIGRILVPRLGGQGLFHDDYPLSTGLLAPPATLAALVACIGAIAGAILVRARAPWLAFAVLWFFAGHALESTFLPLELYFEHRNYLPALGLALGIVALVAGAASADVRRGGMFVAATWLAVACLSVGLNARAWASELQLAMVWHSESQASVRATQFYARALAQAGHPELARGVLADAYRLQPGKAELAFQLAALDCSTGTLSSGGIERLLDLASDARPSQSIDAAMNRLAGFASSRQCALTTADWTRIAQSLLDNPAYGAVGSLAGSLHYRLAVLAETRGDLDAAMAAYDKAYSYLRDARIRQRQALILWSAGLHDEALRHLDLSDATPEPAAKRLMHDIRRDNARIRALIGQQRTQSNKVSRMPYPSTIRTARRSGPSA